MNQTDDLSHWPVLRYAGEKFLQSVTQFYIFNNGQSALLLTGAVENEDEDLKCFAIGDNRFGCLGIGLTPNDLVTQPVEVLQLSRGQTLVQMASGERHLAVVTGQGDLYFWQWNEHLDDDENHAKPTLIMNEVKMISCGGWHTLALKTDGSVWSHGSNFWGQLGIVNNREEQNVFTEVKSLDDKEVSQIYCGAVNSLALTITGRLYHWGAFDFETFNIDTPKELFLDFKIQSITTGYQDFMVLDLEGRPFHCYYEADRKLHCDLVLEDTPVRAITYPNVFADRTAPYCFQLQESGYIVIWNKAGEEGKLIKTMLKSAVDACALYANISTTSQLTILSSSAIDNDDGFNDPRNSNFIIKQGQKRIYLNKTIASEKSKFLADLFEGDWNGRRFIRLNDYPFVVWFTFLRYVHTGKLHCLLQPEWACLLLALALESELDALQHECFEYILGHQEELRQVFQTDPKQARYLARFVQSGKILDFKSVNLDKNLFCK